MALLRVAHAEEPWLFCVLHTQNYACWHIVEGEKHEKT